MAHELSVRDNGFVEMAYLGDVPWHGLGQVIDPSDDLDTIRVKAGMDWQICSSPVFYGLGKAFDDHRVLYRSDSDAPLSVVSKKFKVVQPGEVIEFFRDLCEANQFKLITAGTLFGGKQFWAQADIGESAEVAAGDRIDGKLLLVTSCDGSIATTGKFVNERVVCKNTLSNAMKEAGNRLIKVSHRSVFNDKEAKRQLGIAQDSFGAFMREARKLAGKYVSKRTAENFVSILLADESREKEVTETTGFKQIMNLFEHGAGNHGATAWDLLNGVTEYVDHAQRAQTQSHRLSSSWFGRGDQFKTQAFEMACNLT